MELLEKEIKYQLSLQFWLWYIIFFIFDLTSLHLSTCVIPVSQWIEGRINRQI